MNILPYPVPPAPLLEKSMHYTGDARYIAIFWEPAGDEAMVSDGIVTFTGSAQPYLMYETLLKRMGLQANLGNSEQAATEWLIIDLQERKLIQAPVMDARHFLDDQWPKPVAPYICDEADLKALIDNFFRNLPQPVQPTIHSVERRIREDQENWEKLAQWIANTMRHCGLN